MSKHGYEPSYRTAYNVSMFENQVKMPLRKWMQQHAGEYSAAWMAEKVNVSEDIIRRYAAEWDIKFTCRGKTRFKDGRYPVKFRLKQLGHGDDINLVEAVRRRMKRGAPFMAAVQAALAYRERTPLRTWMREKGIDDWSTYTMVAVWTKQGYSYQDSLDLVLCRQARTRSIAATSTSEPVRARRERRQHPGSPSAGRAADDARGAARSAPGL